MLSGIQKYKEQKGSQSGFGLEAFQGLQRALKQTLGVSAVLNVAPTQRHKRKQVLLRVGPPYLQETSACFMSKGADVHQVSHQSFVIYLPGVMEELTPM